MMKALSIKPPWSTMIVMGLKDVENRTWRSTYRGPLLIHSSKTWDEAGWQFIQSKWPMFAALLLETPQLYGSIIGRVDMVSCVTSHRSQFFTGPYGYVFENPVRFPLGMAVERRGQQRLFNVEVEGLLEKVLELCSKEPDQC